MTEYQNIIVGDTVIFNRLDNSPTLGFCVGQEYKVVRIEIVHGKPKIYIEGPMVMPFPLSAFTTYEDGTERLARKLAGIAYDIGCECKTNQEFRRIARYILENYQLKTDGVGIGIIDNISFTLKIIKRHINNAASCVEFGIPSDSELGSALDGINELLEYLEEEKI